MSTHNICFCEEMRKNINTFGEKTTPSLEENVILLSRALQCNIKKKPVYGVFRQVTDIGRPQLSDSVRLLYLVDMFYR